jgi:hypothetical protein
MPIKSHRKKELNYPADELRGSGIIFQCEIVLELESDLNSVAKP